MFLITSRDFKYIISMIAYASPERYDSKRNSSCVVSSLSLNEAFLRENLIYSNFSPGNYMHVVATRSRISHFSLLNMYHRYNLLNVTLENTFINK